MKEQTFVKPPKGNKALFFEIPSSTNKELTYTVRVLTTGEVRCACTANVMGMKCIHITEFLKQYNEEHEKLMRDIKTSDLVETKEEIKEQKKKDKIPPKNYQETTKEPLTPKEPITVRKKRGFADEFPF